MINSHEAYEEQKDQKLSNQPLKREKHQLEKIGLIKKVLLKSYQKFQTKKCWKSLFLYSIKFLPEIMVTQAVQNQINKINMKTSAYFQIDEKQLIRNQLKNQILLFHKNKISKDQIWDQNTCSQIKAYRSATLQYIESVLKLCKAYSNNQQKIYQKILNKCWSLFIELQQTSLKKYHLYSFIDFEEGFDPLLLSIQAKSGYKKQQIEQSCCFNIKTSDRLIYAHNEMLKSIKHLEIKESSEIKQHSIIKSFDFSEPNKKRCESQKLQKTNKIQKMELQQNKFKQGVNQSINFQKRYLNIQDIKQKLLQNKAIIHNKKNSSFRQRLSLSIDKKSKSFDICDRTTSQSQKDKDKEKLKKPSSQIKKIIYQSKKLNFKSFNLQPIQIKNHQKLTQMNQSHAPNQVNLYRLKRKNLRKRKQLGMRTDQSSQDLKKQLLESDNIQNNKNTIQYTTQPRKKLSQMILRTKHKKFQTEDQHSDINSEKGSPLKSSGIKNNSRFGSRQNRLILNTDKIKLSGLNSLQKMAPISQKQMQFQENAKTLPNDFEQKQLRKNFKQKQIISPAHNDLINFQKAGNSRANALQNCQDTEIQDKNINEQPVSGSSVEDINDSSKNNYQLDQKNIENSRSSKELEKKVASQEIVKKQNDSKKIILKVPKLNFGQLSEYFSKHSINSHFLLAQIEAHQHYIFEFYLNEHLFNIIIFDFPKNCQCISIKLIHQINFVNSFSEENLKNKLQVIVVKKFIEILKKSSSNFKKIKYQSSLSENAWMTQCGFEITDNLFVYDLKSKQSSKIKQFLSVYCSILELNQCISQSLLYSDEICTFKSGKYDVNQSILLKSNQSQFKWESFSSQTLQQANQILESKSFDTFEVNQQIQNIVQNKNLQKKHKVQLKLFNLQKTLKTNFIISNGWIKTQGSLIFSEKNQRISCLLLDEYQMYLGKGFQHIGTMKNKITHFKAKFDNVQNFEKSKKISTIIRMFSKQLYGLIKYDNNEGTYGNWEMNFHFKHEFIGKVNYSIQTSPDQNRIAFGNQSFFVAIYKQGKFLLGWEVQEDDFLY